MWCICCVDFLVFAVGVLYGVVVVVDIFLCV